MVSCSTTVELWGTDFIIDEGAYHLYTQLKYWLFNNINKADDLYLDLMHVFHLFSVKEEHFLKSLVLQSFKRFLFSTGFF